MKKIVTNSLVVLALLVIGGLFLVVLFSKKDDENNVVVIENNNLNKAADAINTLYDEEEAIKEEEAKKAEEAAKAEEEAAKAKAEEEARAKAEEEARIKAEEEAKRLAALNDKDSLKSYAHDLVINSYGWTEYDYECLVYLWNKESGWNVYASNSSGAYGIPQALPASKMASQGSDYLTNGETQIRWGLVYIQTTYGSPSNAWSVFTTKGWY